MGAIFYAGRASLIWDREITAIIRNVIAQIPSHVSIITNEVELSGFSSQNPFPMDDCANNGALSAGMAGRQRFVAVEEGQACNKKGAHLDSFTI
jgi:hypothetical protein